MTPGHTLTSSLRSRSKTHGAHNAVTVGDKSRTYSELAKEARRLAAALIRRDIRPGDRVAWLGRESVHYYETLFAASISGAVLVPVNPRLTAAETAHILRDSGARLVFADPGSALIAADDDRVVTCDTAGLAELVAGFDRPEPSWPVVEQSPDDPVVQLYTSGTTGLPKGVVLAHRSFFAIADSMREHELDWVAVNKDDRCLVGVPGFHIGGLWFATQAFNAGATVIGLPEFDPLQAREAIVHHAVTAAILVPAMMRLLLSLDTTTRDHFSSLRRIVYGGAPISDALLRESATIFDCELAQIYGLTETGNTAICLPAADHVGDRARPGAAGRPYPCVDVKVVDEAGRDLPAGMIGEICLRTPAVMLGYHGLPEATAATLRDGWVHTGDAGIVDADRYVHLKDRVNDMIIVGGENVYPAEIENALCDHPSVLDAAVIGIPDQASGEAVMAFVTVAPDHPVRTRDLALQLRSRVASFKLPRRFEIVDSIPRNASGKILRRLLREPYWHDLDRRVN